MDQPADIHTLSGAYAAGAVDDVERVAFERHLEQCPDCRQEVRELRETLVRLADGWAVTPPQGLRQQVMREIHATPDRPPLHTHRGDGREPTCQHP